MSSVAETRKDRKGVNRLLFQEAQKCKSEVFEAVLKDVPSRNVSVELLVSIVMAANAVFGKYHCIRNEFCAEVMDRVSVELKELPQTLGTFL